MSIFHRALIATLDQVTVPVWIACGIGLLGGFLGMPGANSQLLSHFADSNSLATDGTCGQAMVPSLSDAPTQDTDAEPKSAQTQISQAQISQAESDVARIEKLAKYLTQTRWTGKFTIAGDEDKPLSEEYYEIIEATKAEEEDFWNLVVRIKYGKNDLTLPLPALRIQWAGETPVITVDKMTIPGMGTFDARVLIRKGQYAGTWAHDNVGGHLFGKIEKIADAKPDIQKEEK